MNTWTQEQSALAQSDGWDIFEAGGSMFNDDGKRPYQLQRSDEAGVFDSDRVAWEHVVTGAWSKDEPCEVPLVALYLDALDFLKDQSFPEYRDAINFAHGCIDDRQMSADAKDFVGV